MKEKKLFFSSISVALLILVMTVIFGGLLDRFILLEDSGPSWYYWKLPSRETVPMFTAWLGYFLHQVFIWFGIYKLQTVKEDTFKWNKWLLAINLLFVLLHFVQTHIWYDGLAQDVPVFSSQSSVIGMLVLVLIMENRRRGVIFGKTFKGFEGIQNFILKYHGYYIAWAVVYTFWYHPMVSTTSHLVGFLYIFLILIQGSFAKTKIHNNRNWNFILEVLVLFHGTTVAIGQGNNMWPMFGFGFGLIAICSQIYSLKISKMTRLSIQMIYIAGALIVFGGGFAGKTIADIHQVTWIPVIEYLLVFVIVFFGEGILKIVRKA